MLKCETKNKYIISRKLVIHNHLSSEQMFLLQTIRHQTVSLSFFFINIPGSQNISTVSQSLEQVNMLRSMILPEYQTSNSAHSSKFHHLALLVALVLCSSNFYHCPLLTLLVALVLHKGNSAD